MGYENSGRRPQPTALRMLRGNPSKTKPNALEPKPPPAGEVRKPVGLSAGAGLVWDRLAPVCLHMGTLTVADVDPFATLCELQANMDVARKAKDAQVLGLSAQEAIALEVRLAPIIRPYYALFGLEPVSRARIQVPQKEEPVSKWAGVLK